MTQKRMAFKTFEGEGNMKETIAFSAVFAMFCLNDIQKSTLEIRINMLSANTFHSDKAKYFSFDNF